MDGVNNLVAGLIESKRDLPIAVQDVWLKGSTVHKDRLMFRLCRIGTQTTHMFEMDTIGDCRADQQMRYLIDEIIVTHQTKWIILLRG